MKNFEKYYDDIIECDYNICVNKDGEVRACTMDCDNCIFEDGDEIGACEKIKFRWLFEEYRQPSLTDEEKEYLENIIRPFKYREIKIVKFKIQYLKDTAYELAIDLYNKNRLEHSIQLPPYTEEMYVGMELGKGYGLKDLGLFKGEC